MRFLNFIFALFLPVFIGCTTMGPKPAGKPYDFCLCGPTIDADGKPYCAVWGEGKNPSQANKAFAGESSSSCEPNDCSQFFSKFCQKIQMAGVQKPVPAVPSPSCYCDAVLLENDKGQVQHYCGAWSDEGKNLIEYYALDDCSPQRCLEAPFNLAPKVCNRNFKAFYSPLLNRR